MYVKKSNPIEARLVTVENAKELADWSSGNLARRPDKSIFGILVYNLSGSMSGFIGDYLINDSGNFYFCSREAFQKVFEPLESDPNKIDVTSYTENPDGSATVEFELGSEAVKQFAKIGITKSLSDSLTKLILDEVDTNVGC
jgi:hypothetical protein